MNRNYRNTTSRQSGFTLLELTAAMAILMIISGATLSAVNYYSKNYGRTQLVTDMHSGVRGAVELMTQEISQAGLINSLDSTQIDTTLICNPNCLTGTTTVRVGNAALFYPGEEVQVDSGNNLETIVITAIDTTPNLNTVTGTFTKGHANGVPVYAIGTIAEGIVPPWLSNPTQATPGNYNPDDCCDALDLIGDVNGDGNLELVEYRCDWSYVDSTGAVVWSLTRSSSLITPGGAKSAAVPLVKNIIRNPIPAGKTQSTPCFLYNLKNLSVTKTNGATLNYWYTVNISLTLSVETSQRNPQTGVIDQSMKMTKSFLDLSPRNVNGAYQLAQTSQPGRILARPTGTPTWLP